MTEQLLICEYHIIQLQINKDESDRYTGAERKKARFTLKLQTEVIDV